MDTFKAIGARGSATLAVVAPGISEALIRKGDRITIYLPMIPELIIAMPDKLQFATGLPKTRSGKIMRRILRKIAHNQLEELGDISTLADPSVVENLVKGRIK